MTFRDDRGLASLRSSCWPASSTSAVAPVGGPDFKTGLKPMKSTHDQVDEALRALMVHVPSLATDKSGLPASPRKSTRKAWHEMTEHVIGDIDKARNGLMELGEPWTKWRGRNLPHEIITRLEAMHQALLPNVNSLSNWAKMPYPLRRTCMPRAEHFIATFKSACEAFPADELRSLVLELNAANRARPAAPETSSKRKRLRTRKPTPRQLEAVQMFGEHNGNKTAAARAMKISRATFDQLYKSGLRNSNVTPASFRPKTETYAEVRVTDTDEGPASPTIGPRAKTTKKSR